LNFLTRKISFHKTSYYLFIETLIIFCSFKFIGYVFGFLLLVPFLYLNKKYLFRSIKFLNPEKKLVVIYFSFLILNSIYGAFYIRDFRIFIYWVLFFFICGLSYINNNFLLKKNINYKKNYENLIFNASIFYFLIFFIMNFLSIIIYGNPWDIQNNFWVGGSTSFNISSLFLYILFKKWSQINFKLNTKYTILISLYTFLVLLNESRLGQLYLILFIFFIILKSIPIRKLVNTILISTICFYSFSTGSLIIKYFSLNNIPYYSHKTFFSETRVNLKKFSNIKQDFRNDMFLGDTARLLELSFGIEKFKKSNTLEKIFGTGWYSSRITIAPVRNKLIDKYNLDLVAFKKMSVVQLQGITSLLLDTGIFGMSFTLLLFSLLIKNIIFQRSLFINKLFFLTLTFSNFLCLFIGYPWINVPFILMLIPGGIFLLEEKEFKQI